MGMAAEEPVLRCPQCGVEGVFGYRNKDGDLIWYCAEHRLGRCYADARRDGKSGPPPDILSF